jgi:hypothetical protein
MDGVFEVPSNNGVSKTGFRWQHPKEREPRHSECDIHTWKPPPVHSDTMQLFIIVPCPKCEHPFVVPAKPGNVGVSAAGLSLKAVLTCAGHWPAMDADGRETGGTNKCGWAGVIRYGVAHHPKCPCADFRHSPAPALCRCGQLSPPQEG